MSDYKPGTVAVATVRGVQGVRVMRIRNLDGWVDSDGYAHTPEGEGLRTSEPVTEIRPLVVLDLANNAHAVAALRDTLPAADSDRDAQDWLVAQIADQIEAQTKPPRIPEPGLWGVVEASVNYTASTTRFYVKAPNGWREATGDRYVHWGQLIDPTLIREGVDDDA